MYKFRLQLGDWSNDGHGHTEDIIFETNKDIVELREHYFQNCNKYGNILEELSSDYQDCYIDEDQIEELTDMGIQVGIELLENMNSFESHVVSTDDFADWFVQFMKLDSPDLILERIPKKELPTFHFYGYDDKQRHISFFAYGIFGE